MATQTDFSLSAFTCDDCYFVRGTHPDRGEFMVPIGGVDGWDEDFTALVPGDLVRLEELGPECVAAVTKAARWIRARIAA